MKTISQLTVLSALLWTTACGQFYQKENVIYQYNYVGGEANTEKEGASPVKPTRRTTATGPGLGSSVGDDGSMAEETMPTLEDQTPVDPGGIDPGGIDPVIPDPTPTPTPTPRVAKFQPEEIYFNLQDNCGRCHDWVSVESEVKTKALGTIGRINSGNMPRGVSNWKNTTDGQALLRYLESLNQ